MMEPANDEFWSRHPGLVWSNPDASDAVRIRAALLRPRFEYLLDLALEFGIARLRHEWPDLKRSAQKDLQDAQTQFPSSSFSSLPSVGRTEGNEGNREQRRGI
jgi:hypothetical protein